MDYFDGLWKQTIEIIKAVSNLPQPHLTIYVACQKYFIFTLVTIPR